MDGLVVCDTTSWQDYHAVTSDGSGGAIITWQDNRDGADYDIYLQHVSASGDMLLRPDGLPLAVAGVDGDGCHGRPTV